MPAPLLSAIAIPATKAVATHVAAEVVMDQGSKIMGGGDNQGDQAPNTEGGGLLGKMTGGLF